MPGNARPWRKLSAASYRAEGLRHFIAYLDRVKIALPGRTMNRDLGFSAAVFGFGGGIFFIGYFIFEVPSNVILEKVGARTWIARIS